MPKQIITETGVKIVFDESDLKDQIKKLLKENKGKKGSELTKVKAEAIGRAYIDSLQ